MCRTGGWWQDAFLYARAFTIAGGTNEVLRNIVLSAASGCPRVMLTADRPKANQRRPKGCNWARKFITLPQYGIKG